MSNNGSTVFDPVVRQAHHAEPFESLTAPRKIEGEDRGEASTVSGSTVFDPEAQTRRELAEVSAQPLGPEGNSPKSYAGWGGSGKPSSSSAKQLEVAALSVACRTGTEAKFLIK